MINKREEMVARLTQIMGEDKFQYGDYQEEPRVPFSNYALDDAEQICADDKSFMQSSFYIVRLVTQKKDFELEKQFRQVFLDLEIPFEVLEDDYFKREHAYVAEWVVNILED